MSVVADCLEDHVSPRIDSEAGRINLGARRRRWLVWLKCHDTHGTVDRHVLISEHDAEMHLNGRLVPSKAFSVFEGDKRLGVEVSPRDAGLTMEGLAVRLGRILDCQRVEQVAVMEIEA
jgi:hypothetical protein